MGLHLNHRRNQGVHIPEAGIDIIVRDYWGTKGSKSVKFEIRMPNKTIPLIVSRSDGVSTIRRGIAIGVSNQRRSASTVHIDYIVDREYSLIAKDYEPE